MYTDKELTVYYNNEPITRLNSSLVIRQGVTPENLEELKRSHVLKYMIFEAAKNTDDQETLRALAKIFERLEFAQQRLWGFPEDSSHHRWFDFPQCACPKMDNAERLGTSAGQIINTSCPIHGTSCTPSP